jgi:Family of unknown function (DUF6502)
MDTSIHVRQQVLRDAAQAVLAPLARLCVAQGLPFAQAEELFKSAYVRAARDARREAGAPAARDVSQVSMATGINRREVTRISAELQPLAVQRPAPATQVFLRWISTKKLRGADGKPIPLPRNGPGASFETLATSVTRHVHPRSLLDELCRLGLASLSEDGQTVQLLADHFAPQEDAPRLYAFLAANVGDHLAAASANVLHRDRRHFEQALFTDELSQTSANALRALTQKLWAALAATAVPEIERLIAQDKAKGRRVTHRARIGLFSYHQALSESEHAQHPQAPD